ncbi:hypothetical protein DPEC_G00182670 [Dallia pectoralis]|uniref:Uncharacterized protein n=1 Tax=Dallia pectoralis TaxID=75939 RepID=A0ACC2GAS9_DALPE|nr:hypothetical protein DPEC_G00182670 [Dallia pectoralis]
MVPPAAPCTGDAVDCVSAKKTVATMLQFTCPREAPFASLPPSGPCFVTAASAKRVRCNSARRQGGQA